MISRIFQVNPGSKAEEAGLREGDVIEEINGIPPVTLEEAKKLQKISESGLCLKFSRKSSAKIRPGKSFSSDESEGRNLLTILLHYFYTVSNFSPPDK